MNENTKIKVRQFIHEQLEKLSENDELLDLLPGMFWGENTVQLASDCAANVLIACCESQAEAAREDADD